jgi:NodT family efflux transporter outer membrane factor (OMF) lipoprotein
MRRLLLAAGPLFLAGCTVGPDYVKPPAQITPAYKEQSPTSDTTDADKAGSWVPAHPSDDAIRSNWWEAFGDAELDSLEQQVEAANQDLKSAEARFRSARALIGFARADEFPTIGIGTNVASLKDSANQPYALTRTPRPTGAFALTADVDYEIDLWGRIHRQVTVATEEAQASAADLETARLSLQAELALDYFNLRSADTQQRVLDDTVKSFEDSLQLAQDRLEGGAAPASDVAQAKTQLDTARVQDTDIAVARAQFEHAIAVLIGQPPVKFSLAPSPLDLTSPKIPVGLPSELLERRPDIAAAERRAAEANEQIGIAIAAYYPSVSLSGFTGVEGTSPASWFNWPSLLWAVGTSVAETVYDGGRRDAKTDAARADYDAAIADYRQTTLTAFRQVEDNLAALRILDGEAQQQDEAVDSARSNLKLFTDRYIGGRDSFLQVTIAQTNYLDNERNQVEIRRRRMTASVLLVKALGGGWSTDTGLALDQASATANAGAGAADKDARQER